MTIDEMRRQYPFFTYGSTYYRIKLELDMCKWVNKRLYFERPTDRCCHEWRSLHYSLVKASTELRLAFAKLPHPTDEQNGECDPFVKAEWPEDKMGEIRVADELRDSAEKLRIRAGGIIVMNEYMRDIQHDRLVKSLEQMDKEWKLQKREKK